MSCSSNSSASSSQSGFPDASTMETLASNLPIVWQEISMIQQDILAASSQCQPGGGQMCTTIGGNTPMTFVSGVNSVSVVSGGSGYYQDTPAVTFAPPLGVIPSVIATGTVTSNGGNIFAINVTNGGSGYDSVSATMSVSSLAGTGAVLQPLVDANGAILNINIASAGTGYTVNDTVTATRAVAPNIAYVNAVFAITSVSLTGQIVEVVILNPGSGYQPSTTQAMIVSSLNSSLPYPLGTGFMSTVLISDTEIATLGSIVGGSGYTNGTYTNVLLTGGTGAGARADVNVSGGSVTHASLTNSGTGYTVGDVLSAANVNLGGTIATLGSIVPGVGYTAGTYTNITLTGGNGTGALANITVAAGGVTLVTLVNGGLGYVTTDVLSATTASIGGTGTGFSIPISTISGAGFSVPIATLVSGAVSQVVVNNTGAGYAVDSPYLVISNPGTGAQTAVTLGTGSMATSVSSISVIQPGSNYSLPITGTVFNPATAALPNPPSVPAVVTINISNNTYGTNPNLYWQVWAGVTCNKQIQQQLNQVLSYFTNLGYTISIISNPATGSTIEWQICW